MCASGIIKLNLECIEFTVAHWNGIVHVMPHTDRRMELGMAKNVIEDLNREAMEGKLGYPNYIYLIYLI